MRALSRKPARPSCISNNPTLSCWIIFRNVYEHTDARRLLLRMGAERPNCGAADGIDRIHSSCPKRHHRALTNMCQRDLQRPQTYRLN